jgi:DNA-binding transcriptional regulator YhcF (GntR family)
MGFNFNNEIPIYIQIVEQIKTQILSKKYLPNQKIPSVRDLAFEFEVNPNTVQKALFELESMGLIYTERTNGKFVTTDEKLIESVRQQSIQEVIETFYDSMEKIGLNKVSAKKILLDERSVK